MEFFEAVANRTSIRRYSDRPVEQDKLDSIFQAVQQAPTWANMQCPRFIIVRDRAAKEKLSELSSSEALMAPMGYKANPSRKALAEAPVVVVACADPAASGSIRGQDYYLVDIGIAGQTLMLAASALGLATVFVGIYDEDGVRELLSIPEGVRVAGLFPLGYPLEPDRKKDRPGRKPLSETVYQDRWQGR